MVSVDMIDGVNEPVISATDRIVIQQQSNHQKVRFTPFFSSVAFNLWVVSRHIDPQTAMYFYRAISTTPCPLYKNIIRHTVNGNRQNGRRLG